MKDIKITLKSDISMKDTKLSFEREISMEVAGQIIKYIGECEEIELKKLSKKPL